MNRLIRFGIVACGLIALGAAAGLTSRSPADDPPTPPLGLPPVDWPDDNPYSKAKEELGRLALFREATFIRPQRQLRQLPRSRACLHRPIARFHRHSRPKRGAKRPDGDQSRVQHFAILGRSRHVSRRAGDRPARQPDRDDPRQGFQARPSQRRHTARQNSRLRRRCSSERSATTKSPSIARPRRSPPSNARSIRATPPTTVTKTATKRRCPPKPSAAWTSSSKKPPATVATWDSTSAMVLI